MKLLENRLEVILFTRDEAISAKLLAESLHANYAQVLEALVQLQQRYQATSLELIEVASGWRLQTKADYFADIAEVYAVQVPKYSRAFWETLAYIAYHQPVTRADIDAVRGVTTSSSVYRQLFDLEWIAVNGHREVPGRPELLTTTAQFLDDFALKKASDLPPLPDDIVEGDEI